MRSYDNDKNFDDIDDIGDDERNLKWAKIPSSGSSTLTPKPGWFL